MSGLFGRGEIAQEQGVREERMIDATFALQKYGSRVGAAAEHEIADLDERQFSGRLRLLQRTTTSWSGLQRVCYPDFVLQLPVVRL